MSHASYARLRDAIAIEPEAFFAVRSARLRARATKVPASTEQSLGRLAISLENGALLFFVSWPALPPTLFEDARATARAAGWRPRLWGAGGLLHPDTALSGGPFAISLQTVPAEDASAYPNAAESFGAGSDVALALVARSVDWAVNLLFDPNDDRTQADQRFGLLTGASGYVWVAVKAGGATLDGLRKLGRNCGYTVFEANLAEYADRTILTREGLLSTQSRSLLARHPFDAIGAPHGIVRPERPFLIYREEPAADADSVPQTLRDGSSVIAVAGLSGSSRLQSEAAAAVEENVIEIILFERDSAFDALIERRLQLRVESRLPLRDVPVTAELEIGGILVARGRDTLRVLPLTVLAGSALLSPLYEDAVRTKLLEAGKGSLYIAIGRSAAMHITLGRPPASVEWADGIPHLVGSDLWAELVGATAQSPHRFVPASVVEPPNRGASAYGLRLSDGRIADPIQLFTSNIFDLGDFAAHFGNDLGSRRMFEDGRGVADIARARISWARALCTSLASVGAKARVLRQFEEPLVIDLCGRSWSSTEEATKTDPSDPHEALWQIAVERRLAELPEKATSMEAQTFARAFRKHACLLDPDWPSSRIEPAEGAMDDALNAAFSETLLELQAKGSLLNVEDNFDFGSPTDDWNTAAADALRAVERRALARLIAPSEGGRQLSRRPYAGLGIAELAEDLAAWTNAWALPRGQLTPEAAASALQLWLSPAACDDVDAAVRVLAADPFVSRATRYAALRLGKAMTEGGV
jgi:hypothetical protein